MCCDEDGLISFQIVRAKIILKKCSAGNVENWWGDWEWKPADNP